MRKWKALRCYWHLPCAVTSFYMVVCCADSYEVQSLDRLGVKLVLMCFAVVCCAGWCEVQSLARLDVKLVLLSNSSRPSEVTRKKLPSLGFDPDLFHAIITSGELTQRSLLK